MVCGELTGQSEGASGFDSFLRAVGNWPRRWSFRVGLRLSSKCRLDRSMVIYLFGAVPFKGHEASITWANEVLARALMICG